MSRKDAKYFFVAIALFAPLRASEIADAVMNRQPVRRLLEKHADVNAAQADGATALHWAARWDDLDAATALIQAGANVNAANRDGAPPMFLACVNGSAAMIGKLLKAGADPNAPILPHGETALMMAAKTGNVAAVKALLDAGANVNASEFLRGTTALMWAAEQGHADVIQLLAGRGADLNMTSRVISPVKRRGLGFAGGGGFVGARFAKEQAADQAGQQQLGPPVGKLTALLIAAREGSVESVKALLAVHANANQASVDGSSPMLVAVQNGNFAAARVLLDGGADPNLANGKGWTPLYLAVKIRNQETTAVPGPNADGSLDFIKLLLDHGANPNARITAETEVHQGMTALWLKEAGATPLLRAALCGDLTVIRLLLDHGADPSIPTLDHTTALMVASGVGWADGMLHEYSEAQTLEVIKLLLDKGADVTAANDHGITALHGAAFKGANKAVQLLVDHGAKLDAKDNGEDYGFGVRTIHMTPLNWAEGVPIGMSSAIYHSDTVAILARLMEQRGIPVVTNEQARK